MPKATRTTRAPRRTDRIERPTRHISTRTRPKPEIKPTIPKPVNATKSRRKAKEPPFAFLKRSQEAAESDPNRNTGLLSLPKELIQQIASHLPIHNTICLTLTCKEALHIIGMQPWLDFKSIGFDVETTIPWAEGRPSFTITYRQTLFTLLLRDWSSTGLEFCDGCCTMHPPTKLPREHRKTKLTTRCFGVDPSVDYWPGDDKSGYSLVYLHVKDAMAGSEEFAAKGASGQDIPTLAGDFTVARPNLTWRLVSSGRRIDGNLVIEHVHTLQSATKTPLSAADILSLPVRLCAHQSTTTAMPALSMYIKTKRSTSECVSAKTSNSPLLTHAITTCFPSAERKATSLKSWKTPAPSEQQQIRRAEQGDDIIYKCRACPTKYRVQRASTGDVLITSWHCFGRDLLHAAKYWKWFVRRTGPLLGKHKRNDEWWSQSQSVPDFKIV